MEKFYHHCSEIEKKFMTNYAHIFVEMDFNEGFLVEINLMTPNYVWDQNIDYENISFWCRECYETRHVIKNYTKCSQSNKDCIKL